MHRGLPSCCCSELESDGPWAGFSRLSSWACSGCSCGAAITSNTTSSTADATRMHMKYLSAAQECNYYTSTGMPCGLSVPKWRIVRSATLPTYQNQLLLWKNFNLYGGPSAPT